LYENSNWRFTIELVRFIITHIGLIDNKLFNSIFNYSILVM